MNPQVELNWIELDRSEMVGLFLILATPFPTGIVIDNDFTSLGLHLRHFDTMRFAMDRGTETRLSLSLSLSLSSSSSSQNLSSTVFLPILILIVLPIIKLIRGIFFLMFVDV